MTRELVKIASVPLAGTGMPGATLTATILFDPRERWIALDIAEGKTHFSIERLDASVAVDLADALDKAVDRVSTGDRIDADGVVASFQGDA